MKSLTLLLLSLVFITTTCTPLQAQTGESDLANSQNTPTQTSHIPTLLPTMTDEPPSGDMPSQTATRITLAEERVEFEDNATSTMRSGALPEGGAKEYVLSAAAGQAMTVETVGFNAPVEFTLRSPDGETWPGEPHASKVYIFRAQVVLPQDGDYVVTLSVPPEAGATRYEVAFTVTSSALPTISMPIEPPEHVQFAPGDFSAQRTALLPSGLAVKQYVLAAETGETMTVDITSDDVPVSFTLTSPSGIQSLSEAFPVDGGYRVNHTLTLTETGDYLVTLTKADHTPSTNYTAHFTVK